MEVKELYKLEAAKTGAEFALSDAVRTFLLEKCAESENHIAVFNFKEIIKGYIHQYLPNEDDAKVDELADTYLRCSGGFYTIDYFCGDSYYLCMITQITADNKENHNYGDMVNTFSNIFVDLVDEKSGKTFNLWSTELDEQDVWYSLITLLNEPNIPHVKWWLIRKNLLKEEKK